MSNKNQSTFSEPTGGDPQYIKQYDNLAIGSMTLDFSNVNFEDNRHRANHLMISNHGGIYPVYVLFGGDADDIDTTDPTTYTKKVYAGLPYTRIELDCDCDKLGLKCASGQSTTVTVLAW